MLPTSPRISIIATTITSAAITDGTRCACSHSIGRSAIKAKNTASRNGTSSTLAACMPNTMTTTAATLISALLLVAAGVSTVTFPGDQAVAALASAASSASSSFTIVKPVKP